MGIQMAEKKRDVMKQSNEQDSEKVAPPDYCPSCYATLVEGGCPLGHDCSSLDFDHSLRSKP